MERPQAAGAHAVLSLCADARYWFAGCHPDHDGASVTSFWDISWIVGVPWLILVSLVYFLFRASGLVGLLPCRPEANAAMQISYFLLWHARSGREPAFDVDVASYQCLRAWSSDVPQLTRYVLHTRSATSDPYGDDVGGPALVLQCYFDNPVALDFALASNGASLSWPLQHDVKRMICRKPRRAKCRSRRCSCVVIHRPPAR